MSDKKKTFDSLGLTSWITKQMNKLGNLHLNFSKHVYFYYDLYFFF